MAFLHEKAFEQQQLHEMQHAQCPRTQHHDMQGNMFNAQQAAWEHETQPMESRSAPRTHYEMQENMRAAVTAYDSSLMASETERTSVLLSAHNSHMRRAIRKDDVAQLGGGDHREREQKTREQEVRDREARDAVARDELANFAGKLTSRHWRT